MAENNVSTRAGVIRSLVTTVCETINKAAADALERAKRISPGSESPKEDAILVEAVKENLVDSFMVSFLPEVKDRTLCMEKLQELFKIAMDCGEGYLSGEDKTVLAGNLMACFRSGLPCDHLVFSSRRPARNLSEVEHLRPSGKTVFSLMKALSQLPLNLVVEPLTLTVVDYRTPGERLKVEPAPY